MRRGREEPVAICAIRRIRLPGNGRAAALPSAASQRCARWVLDMPKDCWPRGKAQLSPSGDDFCPSHHPENNGVDQDENSDWPP
ncbi:UNVERIFIED_CONTAM: hypothetical protein K2H54_026287 [Gekko kuhli]